MTTTVNLEIKEIGPGMNGIFACQDIKEGEYIFRQWNDSCRRLSSTEVQKLHSPYRELFETYSTELEAHLFVGPYEDEDISSKPEYFINHSCDPNTYLVSDDDVAARRNIQTGEQITIDYATLLVHMFESSRIVDCQCKTALCRKEVTTDDWWTVRDIYRDHFTRWIEQKIEEREKSITQRS